MILIFYQTEAVLKSECLQEPQDNGGDHDDGSGTLDEGPASFPGRTEHADHGRYMIGRKLHNEGSGFAGKCLEFLQHDTGQDNGGNTQEIAGYRYIGGTAEHSAGDQADDRELGAAGDKGRGHNGHLAVTVLFNGTGSHDSGNAAAGSDDDRDKGLAGQAELAEQTVHDESDTGHVADILQDGEHQEQDQHLGHETDDRAYAGDNTVLDQSVQDCAFSDAEGRQQGIDRAGHDLTEQDIVGPVSGHCTDGDGPVAHGDGVNEEHDSQEDRDAQDPVGHDLVDLVRRGQGVFFRFLLYGSGDYAGDEVVSFIGNDTFGIIIQRVFHSRDDCFHLFGKRHGLQDLFISFEELDRVPVTEFEIDTAVKRFFDLTYCFSDFSSQDFRYDRSFSGLSGLNRQFRCLQAVLIFKRADFNDFTMQFPAQGVNVDPVAVLADQIHHVDGDDDGHAQLEQLCGQIQVTFNVGTVHNIEDGIGLLVDQIVSGDHFLQGIGGQGINTGKVLDDDILVSS